MRSTPMMLDDLREELGDLLLQVVFHARLAEENRRPSVVYRRCRRRGGREAWSVGIRMFSPMPTAETAEDVEANWHDIKVAEKGRKSPIDGVPLALPALALAAKLVDRRDHSGADVPIEEPELPPELDDELFGLILLGLVGGCPSDETSTLRRRCDAARWPSRQRT